MSRKREGSSNETTATKVTIHDLTLDSDDESPATGQDYRRSGSVNSNKTSKSEASKRGSKDADQSHSSKDKQTKKTGHDEKESDTSKDKRSKKMRLSRTKRPKADIGSIFSGESALDQTSDFAGGFTPYKALAEKKLSRQKRQATANTSQRSTKEGESQSDKTISKLSTRRNISRSSKNVEKEKADKEVTQEDSSVQEETSSRTQVTNQETRGTNEAKKEHGESLEDGESTGDTCHMCGENIQQGLANHMKVCLRSRFQRNKKCSSTTTGSDTQSKTDNKRLEDEENYVFCQVCQDDITALSTDQRTAHVNACIDGTSKNPERRDVTDAGSGVSEEKETCHICQRDISEFNSHRRQLHVNYCVDKAESERKETELALKKAREKVLDCPLCGKPLQTQASRRKHLKQCARDLQVNPGLVAERVKQQEEEYKLQLAAGVLPPPVKVTRPRNSRRKPPSESGSERIVRPSALDADTQLALALSSSLHEHRKSEIQAATGAPPSTPDQNQMKKDAFSVLMTPKPAKRAKRGKKNKEPERVPELLLHSREDLQRHLATKMQQLLAQVGGEISNTPPIRSTRLKDKKSSSTLKDIHFQIVKDAPWWTLTKLPKESLADDILVSSGDSDKDKENHKLGAFYVRQLMPPVTMTTGRPHKTKQPSQQTSGGEPFSGAQTHQGSRSLPSSNESLLPTTQTAMVLAELATEAGNATLDFTALGTTILDQTAVGGQRRGKGDGTALQDTSQSKDTDPVRENESTGYLTPKCGKDKQGEPSEGSCLLGQLGSMVDNPLLSDLKLQAKDGSLHGHKFMFAIRCPHVLNTLNDAGDLPLPEYDSSTVKGVLQFIYTGTTPNITPQVYSLATRWCLAELVKKCQVQLPDFPDQDDLDTANTSQARLDIILKKIWGSDYEESDSEDEENQKADLKEDQEIEEECKQVLTQRKEKEANEEEEESENSGDEECIDRLNMTAADVLNELAMMDDEDSKGDSSEDEVLALELETGESSSPEDESVNNIKIVDNNKKEYNLENTQQQGATQNQRFERNQQLSQRATQKMDVSQGRKDIQNVRMTQTKRFNQSQVVSHNQELRDDVSSAESDCLADPMEIDQDVDKYKAFSPQTIDCASTADIQPEPHEDSSYSGHMNDGSDIDKHHGHSSPQTIYSDSACDNHSVSSKLTHHSILDEEDDIVNEIMGSPQIIDSGSELDNEKTDEISNHENTEKDQDAPSTTSERIKISDSPGSIRDGRDGCQEISTPELFGASPHTPNTLDKTPVSGALSRSTQNYDMSDDDLFEVCSHSSEEVVIHEEKPTKISNTCSEDEEAPKSCPDSPVFVSRAQAKRPHSSKDLDPILSDGDNTLHHKHPHDDDNDADAEDDGDDGLGSQSAKYKRKRSSSDSPRALLTPHRKKRPRIGSLVNNTQLTTDKATQKAVSEESSSVISHSPPPSPPLPSPGVGHINARATSARTHREEYVISSDSDLDAAPIDLTQGDDDLNHNDPDPAQDDFGQNNLDQGDLDQSDLDHNELGHDSIHDLGVIRHAESDSRPGSPVPSEGGRLQGGGRLSGVQEHSPVSSPGVPDVDHDVWSDFDDPGYTEDFMMPSSRGSQKSGSQKSQPSAKSPPQVLQTVDYDPPTDIDTDTSMLDPTTPRPTRIVKTPKQAVLKKRRRPAIPPSPFTPMASYDQMVTPELKKACQNVGVRPMPKKKMITVLKDIYQTTHQFETDSEFEASFDAGRPSCSSTETGRVRKPNQPAAAVGMPEDDVPPFSQAASQSCSQYPQGGEDLMEESFVGSQSTQSSPSSSPEKNTSKRLSVEQKREKIRSYILGNNDLYLKILNYEPLEFDEFRQELKDRGTTMGSDIVMDFLDEQNIQFTMRKRKEEKMARKRSPTKRGRGRGRGRRPAASQK